MKLDDKKLLDIVYTLLGVCFYYFKLFIRYFGWSLKGFNRSEHVTNKDDLKRGLTYSRAPNYFDVDLSSSGTTGEPTTVWASPLHWISEQSAQMEYFSNNGYRFRDKMVIVRGYAPKAGQHFIKRDKLRNFVWISPFHLKQENIQEVVAELNGRYFLRGYPSSLELLANLLEGNTFSSPKASFTASETLTRFQRNKIEEVFASKVFDWYGTSEPAVLLFQDESSYPFYRAPLFHCRLKLDVDKFGKARIFGASMWDTLSNIGFYDTGDIAILKDDRVIEIKGRSSDVVSLDGVTVPVTNFLTVFYGCRGVSRFQIVNFEDVVVFIVRAQGHFEIASLMEELDKRLGESNYFISEALEFFQSHFGKTPHFINKTSIAYEEFYNK